MRSFWKRICIISITSKSTVLTFFEFIYMVLNSQLSSIGHLIKIEILYVGTIYRDLPATIKTLCFNQKFEIKCEFEEFSKSSNALYI